VVFPIYRLDAGGHDHQNRQPEVQITESKRNLAEDREFQFILCAPQNVASVDTMSHMSDTADGQERFAARPAVFERGPERIYGRILNLIISQSLVEGDRLPAERQLAERFTVSRPVVREALMRLAADGIVTARRGSGSFIRRRPSEHLMLSVPLDDIGSRLSTYEMRFALEGEAARLAAIRCTEEDAKTLIKALASLEYSLMNGLSWQTDDISLHRTIILISKNAVFTQVFDLLNDSIIDIMTAGVSAARDADPSLAAKMFDEHAAIVEAIRAGDGQGAELAMRHHLYEGRKRLMR
jgi:GntR family transcriptional regulator, transcriptional repressor for pyruvate dehydrogenase complex